MTQEFRIKLSLFSLRGAIFLVMSAWAIDKILRYEHASMIFQDYYYLPVPGPGLMMVIGLFEMLILLLFLAGFQKRISYGLVLLFHSISTIAPFYQYASGQLLFYAAFPMWAGCFTLYLLRDLDTLFSFNTE